MSIKPRSYYQFIERDTDKISLKWQVLHAFIFVLIAVNAFWSAYAFQDIFDAFNYRCVLYAKPFFQLRNIEYHAIIDETNTTLDVNSTFETPTAQALQDLYSEFDEDVSNETIWNEKLNFKVANVPDVEVKNGRYQINNETMTGEVFVDMRKTAFTNLLLCDFALFVPLFTMVIGIFFAALVVICGKGGRGYMSNM